MTEPAPEPLSCWPESWRAGTNPTLSFALLPPAHVPAVCFLDPSYTLPSQKLGTKPSDTLSKEGLVCFPKELVLDGDTASLSSKDS